VLAEDDLVRRLDNGDGLGLQKRRRRERLDEETEEVIIVIRATSGYGAKTDKHV